MQQNRSQNAVTNGVYARDTVLPWESPEEFAAFYHSIRCELQPVGPLEEEAVRDIADLHWRKRRLALGALLAFYRDALPPELAEAAKGGVRGLAAFVNSEQGQAGGSIAATSAQILSYVKAKMANGESQPNLPQTAAVERKQASLDRAYDPAVMATYVKTEAMLDARIAKAMARLVALKDYKVIYHEPDWTPEGQKRGWTVTSASDTNPAISKG